MLIVDDDAAIRGLVTMALAAAGCETYAAADGGEAIFVLERTRVDLALIDIVMPGKEGVETIIEAKARWPALKVIAISGSDIRRHFLGIARGVGADMTMIKPLNLTQMIAHIERLLTSAKLGDT